ncbi:MAG: protein kinase domain-containing protein [Ktedonobacteraceae bacterium]
MVERAGQQLGNYRLLSLLGQGGFAEVYLGEHVFLKKAVAIKVLYTQLGKDDLEGFLKEAQTIAQLEHPHIVRVTDFGLDGDLPYLVMEYAPNGTLRQRHPRDTTLPLATISAYVKQIASALQYAHDEKLVHRDIKPENMLLNRHHELLLSDFGLAIVAHRTATQNTQSIAGTAIYMAPELFRGRYYAASDQYALGIVVYEWLTGQPPFIEGDFIQLGFQHTYVAPEPLIEKNPALPKDVEQVVMTALAKDPKQRFGSVKAFANALEQVCLTAAAARKEEEAEIAQPALTPNQNSLPASTSVVSMQVATSDNQLQSQNKNTPSSSEPSVSMGAMIYQQQPLMTEYIPPMSTSVIAKQTSSPTAETKPVVGNLSALAQPKRTVSRRSVIIGLGIAGLAVVGGGITWLVDLRKPGNLLSTNAGHLPITRPSGTGTLLYTYKGHSYAVTSIAWSPDGQRIASGSADKTVQVWQAV